LRIRIFTHMASCNRWLEKCTVAGNSMLYTLPSGMSAARDIMHPKCTQSARWQEIAYGCASEAHVSCSGNNAPKVHVEWKKKWKVKWKLGCTQSARGVEG